LEFREAAKNAAEPQIEALASLQNAILSQDENLIETAEFVVEEASNTRERITEEYRYHLRTHRCKTTKPPPLCQTPTAAISQILDLLQHAKSEHSNAQASALLAFAPFTYLGESVDHIDP